MTLGRITYEDAVPFMGSEEELFWKVVGVSYSMMKSLSLSFGNTPRFSNCPEKTLNEKKRKLLYSIHIRAIL